jgi:hypothetical protein
MEDENNDALMTEFIGPRTKMYAIRVHDIQECVNKIKGIKRNVVAKNIDLEYYIEYRIYIISEEQHEKEHFSCVSRYCMMCTR